MSSVRTDSEMKAARNARSLEPNSRLPELAFDFLTRQGEAKTAFSGRDFVARLAKEHGVENEHAQTPYGDFIALLSSAQPSDDERAFLVAVGMLHLARKKVDDVRKFAGHAVWFELEPRYPCFALANEMLSEEKARVFWGEVLSRAIAEKGENAASVARAACAFFGARTFGSELGALSFERALAKGPPSTAIEKLASAYFELPQNANATETKPAAVVVGELQRGPRSSWVEALRLVSGWAVFAGLARTLGSILGVRRHASCSIEGGNVIAEVRTTFAKREISRSKWVVTPADLRSVKGHSRFRPFYGLVGVLFLIIGVGMGGWFVGDGVLRGKASVVAGGASMMLLGAFFDLLFDVVLPGPSRSATLDLSLRKGGKIRIRHIVPSACEAFITEIERRVLGR